jgi:DNA-binding response OmpR family regulator
LLVLVVDDAEPTRRLVARALTSEGFVVDEAADGHQARQRLDAQPPDVVVLDVELPDTSGFELLREILATTAIPVVMLSARHEELDRVLGLEMGAEDYVVKPFLPRELAARVRRAARRRPVTSAARLEFPGLAIDPATREVLVEGRAVELTGREFDLLAHLAAAPRRVFSRHELLVQVWHSSADWQNPKTVTEHVRRVRHKIEADPTRPRWIKTVGSAGYRFDP